MGKDLGPGASVGDSRISNAVSYSTPDRWAFGGMFQVARREQAANGYPGFSAYGVELHYTLATWYFQGHAMYNNTDPTAAVPSFRNGWYGLAVKKDLGNVTLTYMYNALRPERAGYPMAHTHVLGLTMPHGANTIRISPAYRNVAGNHGLNAFALGLGYDYNLSKNTALYTRIGYVANRSRATATLGSIPAGAPGGGACHHRIRPPNTQPHSQQQRCQRADGAGDTCTDPGQRGRGRRLAYKQRMVEAPMVPGWMRRSAWPRCLRWWV